MKAFVYHGYGSPDVYDPQSLLQEPGHATEANCGTA